MPENDSDEMDRQMTGGGEPATASVGEKTSEMTCFFRKNMLK